MEILIQKNDLLTMLDHQSKEWLTPQNMEEKLEIELNNLLPPIIASHKDYYNRLIKFSYNIEQGKFEEAEDVKINKKIVEYKNKLLAPLYQELKTVIKYLTITEENSVFELYRETINRIKSRFEVDKDTAIKTLMEKITYDFKKLITLIRLENEKPENKLMIIESQLKSLAMILVIWNKYTDIIYKPDERVEEQIDESKKLSFNVRQRLESKTPEDMIKERDSEGLKNYYLDKITDKKGKGAGLFLTEFNLEEEPIDRRRLQETKSEKGKGDKVDKSSEKKGAAGSKKGDTEKTDDEFEITKARSFDISEKNFEKKPTADKAKKGKKDKFALDSDDMKSKKNKKASIEENKRLLLENEVSEIFADEVIASDEDEQEPNKDKNQKDPKLQANIDKNQRDLEEFEKLSAEEAQKEPEDLIVNEKLKNYYDKLNKKNLKEAKATKAKANLEEEQKLKQQIEELIQPEDMKSGRDFAQEYLKLGLKKDLDCKKLYAYYSAFILSKFFLMILF